MQPQIRSLDDKLTWSIYDVPWKAPVCLRDVALRRACQQWWWEGCLWRNTSAGFTTTSWVICSRSLPLPGPQFPHVHNVGVGATYSPEVPSCHLGLGPSLPLQCDYEPRISTSPARTLGLVLNCHHTLPLDHGNRLPLLRTCQNLPGRVFRYKWVTSWKLFQPLRYDLRYLTVTWVCQKEAATLSLILIEGFFLQSLGFQMGVKKNQTYINAFRDR